MADEATLYAKEVSDTTQQPDQKKQKYFFAKTDGIFAVAFFVLGYLYVQWAFPFKPSLSTALFIVLFLILGILYGKVCGFHQSKKTIPYIIIMILGAVRFVVFDQDLPSVMLFLFISIMAVYWVGTFALKRIGVENDPEKDKFSSFFIWDILNQLFCVPFSHFSCAFENLKSLLGKGKNSKTSGQVLIGILLCIPIGFVLIGLLCSADVVFQNLMNLLYEVFFGKIYSSVIKFFIAIPVWCYFFGLFYGNLRDRSFRGITFEKIEKTRKGMCRMPKATAYTVLTMINIIYILFFVSQSAYLFSGFSNLLPAEFTYAQYARQGFFQLCVIALINFAITWFSFIIVERNAEGKRSKILAVLTAILSVFTLLFIATALSKMAMYIHYYGLTRLRIYASWFMVLLFILFIILMIKGIVRFHAPKVAFVIFCISFFALCFSNVDGFMTKYNITRFEEGTLSSFRVEDYRNLSAGAVPYLYEFYNHISPDGTYTGTAASEGGNTDQGIMAMSSEELLKLKSELAVLLTREESGREWYNGDLKTFNIQGYIAQKLVFD